MYVYFKATEVKEYLGIRGNDKVMSVFKELEGVGLIIRKRGGNGNPSKIYVMDFSEETNEAEQTSEKQKTEKKQTSEKRKSGKNTDFRKSEVQTSEKRKSVFPYKSKTENLSIHLSTYQENPIDEMDKMDEIVTVTDTQLFEDIRSQIDYDYLLNATQGKEATLDLIVEIMTEVYLQKRDYYYINSVNVSATNVKSMFQKLNGDHITYIFDCIDDVSTRKKVRNIRNYLLTCMYNAPHVMELSYDTQVAYDICNL